MTICNQSSADIVLPSLDHERMRVIGCPQAARNGRVLLSRIVVESLAPAGSWAARSRRLLRLGHAEPTGNCLEAKNPPHAGPNLSPRRELSFNIHPWPYVKFMSLDTGQCAVSG